MDAIIKESQSWSNYYCDATTANGLRFDGIQQVSSISIIGGTCQIQAKGNFSALTSCYPPTNTQALNICQNYHPNGYNYNGNLSVLNYTNTPTGGFCSANFKANYIKAGNQQLEYKFIGPMQGNRDDYLYCSGSVNLNQMGQEIPYRIQC